MFFLEKYKLQIVNEGFSQDKIEEFRSILINRFEVYLKSPTVKQSVFFYSEYLDMLRDNEKIYPIEVEFLKIKSYLNTVTTQMLKSRLSKVFNSSTVTNVIFDSGSKIRQPAIEKWQEDAKLDFSDNGLVLVEKNEVKMDFYTLPEIVKFDVPVLSQSSEFLNNEIKSWTLKNGIKVNYIYQPNDAKQTYMMFTTNVRDIDLEPNLRLALANYSYLQISSGLNGLTFDEISKQLMKDNMGLSSLQSSPNYYGLSEYTQLNALAEYMHRMLAEPIVDQPKTLELIDQLKESYASDQQSFSWLSEKNRVSHIFGESPYYSAIGINDAENQLSVEQLESVRQILLSKIAKPTFLIAGELSEQDAIELSENYFSNIQTNDNNELLKQSPIEDIKLPEAGRFNIGYNEIQYDNVIMYFTSKALTKSDKNIDQMKVFNYLFGNFIFDEMREKRGLIYGPSSTYYFKDRFMPFGFFYVSFQAGILKEDEFYAMFDTVLNDFFEQKVDLEMLTQAKEALNVEVQAEITLPTILNVYLNNHQSDFSFDRYYENKGVDGVTLEEVNAFKQTIKNDYVRTTLTTYPR